VVGAGGLLLPSQKASAQLIKLKRIRWVISNIYGWGDNIPLNFYQRDYQHQTWIRIQSMTLNDWKTQVLESPPHPSDYEPHSLVEFGAFPLPASTLHSLEGQNPTVGAPWVSFDGGEQKAPNTVPSQCAFNIPNSNRQVRVHRGPDTPDFKVFNVDLIWQMGTKDNNDNKGKGNNGNNGNTNRRRKQRGGGGLSDVDRRKRPVDRLLD